MLGMSLYTSVFSSRAGSRNSEAQKGFLFLELELLTKRVSSLHWDNWLSIPENSKVSSYLIPLSKINSRRIKDLKEKQKQNIRQLVEHIREHDCDIGTEKGFFDPKSKTSKGDNTCNLSNRQRI